MEHVRRDEGGAAWFGKVAISAADAARLRHEVARLRRAAHPGVVEVGRWVDDGDAGAELWTRSAGTPLAAFGALPGAEVAGLGAATATVLADLHDLGLVHGRVDDGHILVGTDGRPVLCGFGGGGEDPGVDVDGLVATLRAHLEPGAPRRLERALRPGRRRPRSARALATALGGAVPDRRLPGPHPAPAGSGAAEHEYEGVEGDGVGVGGVGSPDRLLDTAGLPRVGTGGTRAGPTLRPHPLRLDGDADVPVDDTPQSGPAQRGRAHRSPVSRGSGPAGPMPLGATRALRDRLGGRRGPVVALGVAALVALAVVGFARHDTTTVTCPSADLGCGPLPLRHGRFTTGSGSWAVGVADPVVVVGRWDCGPAGLPAALDRRTGQVWAWTAWAGPTGTVPAHPVASRPGATGLRVVPGGSGCDRLAVIGPGRLVTVVRPGGPDA